MKLYSILFEQDPQQSVKQSNPANYLSKPFALLHNNTIFVLYNAEQYPNPGYIAAYIKTREYPNTCPMATQIAQSVRGPSYPGAGETLYKIVSSILKRPITSDRGISTSKAAQKTWAKIANNPEYQKIRLDNWMWNNDYQTKTYVHNINKSNNSFEISDTPATPQPEDDCVLPGEEVDKDNPNDVISASVAKLGTPDAFQANVDFSELVNNNQEMIQTKKVDPKKIFADGDRLFRQTELD